MPASMPSMLSKPRRGHHSQRPAQHTRAGRPQLHRKSIPLFAMLLVLLFVTGLQMVPMPDGDTRHDDGQTETTDEEQSSRPPASPKVRNKNTHPKLSRLDAAHDGLEEPKASAALHTRHALPEDTNSGDLIVTEQTDDAKSDVSDVDNHGDEALDDGNEEDIGGLLKEFDAAEEEKTAADELPANEGDKTSRDNLADTGEGDTAEEAEEEEEQQPENEGEGETKDGEEEAEVGDNVRDVDEDAGKSGDPEDGLTEDNEHSRIAELVAINEDDGDEKENMAKAASLDTGLMMRAGDSPGSQEGPQGADKQAAADRVATRSSREEAGGVSLDLQPQDHESANGGDERRGGASNAEEVRAGDGEGGSGKEAGASGTAALSTAAKVLATVEEGGIEAKPDGQENKHADEDEDEDEEGDNEDKEAHDDMAEIIGAAASRSKMTDQGRARNDNIFPELGEADAADAMDEYEAQAALRAFSSSRPRIPVKINNKAAGSIKAASSGSSGSGTGSTGPRKGPGAALSGMNRSRLKDLIEAQQRGGGPVPNKDRGGDATRNNKRPSNGGVLRLVSSAGASSGRGSGKSSSPGSKGMSGRHQDDQRSRQHQRPERKGNEPSDDEDGEGVDEEAARKAKSKYLYQDEESLTEEEKAERAAEAERQRKLDIERQRNQKRILRRKEERLAAARNREMEKRRAESGHEAFEFIAR